MSAVSNESLEEAEKEPEIPKIVMGYKNFQCPICYSNIQSHVDLYATHREKLPHEVEKHLGWHYRNDTDEEDQ